MFKTLLTSILLFYSSTCAEKCSTPNKEDGECISLFSCTILLSAVNSQQPDAVEFVKQSNCGGDAFNPLVCCGPSSNFTLDNKNETDCGYQHSDDYPKNDNWTKTTEFPWLAAIVYKYRFGGMPNILFREPSCAGSLINERYVLTAAQCLTDQKLKAELVYFGEYKDCFPYGSPMEKYCRSNPDEVYGIENIIFHPDHDIGLIRLNATVKYNDYLRPICLPLSGTKLPEPGDILQSPGWGNAGTETKAVYIKSKISGTLITNEQCTEQLKSIALEYFKQYNQIPSYYIPKDVNENETCISTTKIDNDVKTLGGPLMYPSGKLQWQIEGIASFMSKTGRGVGRPEGFTKVRKNLDWILENIKQ